MTSVTSNDLSEPLWSLMASVVSNGLSDLKRPQIVQVLSKLYTQICVDSTGALHFYRATSYLVMHSTVWHEHIKKQKTPFLPFVKSAGRKRQLISTLNKNLPESFGTYFEPFLGGGALLFNMLTENNKQKCIISDLNSDLVLAYATIRDNVDDLISSLKQHEFHKIDFSFVRKYCFQVT